MIRHTWTEYNALSGVITRTKSDRRDALPTVSDTIGILDGAVINSYVDVTVTPHVVRPLKEYGFNDYYEITADDIDELTLSLEAGVTVTIVEDQINVIANFVTDGSDIEFTSDDESMFTFIFSHPHYKKQKIMVRAI
tara:strand:- start:5136 stop:5546 length:411 start_codon:yes stop_codon:yes gene_type:complete